MAKSKSRAARLGEAAALVESAKEIVVDLKSGMENWRDSVPENLQGGGKYSQIEECISGLEEIESGLEGIEWDGVEFPGMMG